MGLSAIAVGLRSTATRADLVRGSVTSDGPRREDFRFGGIRGMISLAMLWGSWNQYEEVYVEFRGLQRWLGENRWRGLVAVA